MIRSEIRTKLALFKPEAVRNVVENIINKSMVIIGKREKNFDMELDIITTCIRIRELGKI